MAPIAMPRVGARGTRGACFSRLYRASPASFCFVSWARTGDARHPAQTASSRKSTNMGAWMAPTFHSSAHYRWKRGGNDGNRMLSEAGYWGSSVHQRTGKCSAKLAGLHGWAGPRYRAKTLERQAAHRGFQTSGLSAGGSCPLSPLASS